MAMPLLKENIPSQQKMLIEGLEGQRIVKLIRYSWYPTEEIIQDHDIHLDQIFSLAAGPVLMSFASGLVVGASSDPAKNSVVLWVEKNEDGDLLEELTEDDDELYPINAKDQPYWRDFLGKSIESLKIIFRDPVNSKMKELPNEVGLAIRMANGLEFVLSHGLHDNSDDFSVLMVDRIDRQIRSQLTTEFGLRPYI